MSYARPSCPASSGSEGTLRSRTMNAVEEFVVHVDVVLSADGMPWLVSPAVTRVPTARALRRRSVHVLLPLLLFSRGDMYWPEPTQVSSTCCDRRSDLGSHQYASFGDVQVDSHSPRGIPSSPTTSHTLCSLLTPSLLPGKPAERVGRRGGP